MSKPAYKGNTLASFVKTSVLNIYSISLLFPLEAVYHSVCGSFKCCITYIL